VSKDVIVGNAQNKQAKVDQMVRGAKAAITDDKRVSGFTTSKGNAYWQRLTGMLS
jgi:hypothetical protein